MRDGWLTDQKQYQKETYGVDYPHMARDAENRTAYVSMNLTAAIIELGEAYQEVPWKPWAKVDKDAVWTENRHKFIGEIVDTLFFLANALTAVGCDDQELAMMYQAKMGVNKKRQEDGYDGISTKCAFCKAALDEPKANKLQQTQDAKGRRFCSSNCEIRQINKELGR